jgi:hypothetical protein
MKSQGDASMKSSHLLIAVAVAATFLAFACDNSANVHENWAYKTRTRTIPELTFIKDQNGRYLYIQGVNLGGSNKVPYGDDPLNNMTEAPNYIGRPFPLADADKHFGIIKAMGFNAVRLLFNWEAVEPNQRGVYNTEYLDFFEKVISKANDHGIYVLLNAHENLFSRFHQAFYNEVPLFGNRGDLLGMVGSLIPYLEKNGKVKKNFYSDVVRGDGAPRWVAKACMPEKNFDAKSWGTFRVLGYALDNWQLILDLINKIGGGGGTPPIDIVEVLNALNAADKAGILPKNPRDTTDSLPWTFWGANVAISLDIERCYAAFFAGDVVFPGYKITDNGKKYDVKEYMQEAYTNMWLEVVKRASKYPNIIGYDIMNEPTSVFIILTAASALFQGMSEEDITKLLKNLLGDSMGQEISDLIFNLMLLPALPKLPDKSDPTYEAVKKQRDQVLSDWGFAYPCADNPANTCYPDFLAMAGLNIAFGKNHLQPLYERVGQAIQKIDPNAVIWIEEAFSVDMLLGSGLGGQWDQPMLVPQGINQLVFSPHWYPDIYPYLGFNQPPRTFTPDEVRYRDYKPSLESKFLKSAYEFSNIPSVYGEFGTYWNYNGIENSIKDNYLVSSLILNNFYEAFESMFLSNMVWVYTADNDYRLGDKWDKEDFSVLDPYQIPRGDTAYSRPHATFMPGKPVRTYYYSDFHYYVPEKGIVNPLHEYYVEFQSKETLAPAEIFVPASQYQKGFYVWLSDGYAAAEYNTVKAGVNNDYEMGYYILYVYPGEDYPGINHWVKITQPLTGDDQYGWNYFFKEDYQISKK